MKELLTPQYLRVTNYEKYQHYKDRRPIWVKFYVELLDDYDLNRQKPHTRLVALSLILVAATQDNRIPYDTDWLARELHLKAPTVADSLESLITIGFLTLASRKHSASKTLAMRSGSASPEKSREEKRRVEKEKKEPRAVSFSEEAKGEPGERPLDSSIFKIPNLREVS